MNRPRPTDQASRILEITRVFDAPREVVFRHFVDPALIAKWWGPDGFVVAPNAETGWTQQLAKLERLLAS